MTPLTNCPTKVKAREASIIKPWHLEAVPSDQAYVTLCGPMSSRGRLLPNCELKHLVRERFIEPRQFHGIECKESVWHNNVRAVEREGYPVGNSPILHPRGDLLAILSGLVRSGTKIAVLNIDLQVGPKEGIRPLTRSLSILNEMPAHPALVVWNIIVKSPYRGLDMSYDLEAVLRGHVRFQRTRLSGGWVSPAQVRYQRAHTTMHSLVLHRQGTAQRKSA
jgi:hypothetical protein